MVSEQTDQQLFTENVNRYQESQERILAACKAISGPTSIHLLLLLSEQHTLDTQRNVSTLADMIGVNQSMISLLVGRTLYNAGLLQSEKIGRSSYYQPTPIVQQYMRPLMKTLASHEPETCTILESDSDACTFSDTEFTQLIEHRETLTILPKSITSMTRLEIVLLLLEQPLSVSEITHSIDVGQPCVSEHLGLMEDIGVVDGQRNGQHTVYSLHNGSKESYLQLFEILEIIATDPKPRTKRHAQSRILPSQPQDMHPDIISSSEASDASRFPQ